MKMVRCRYMDSVCILTLTEEEFEYRKEHDIVKIERVEDDK